MRAADLKLSRMLGLGSASGPTGLMSAQAVAVLFGAETRALKKDFLHSQRFLEFPAPFKMHARTHTLAHSYRFNLGVVGRQLMGQS